MKIGISNAALNWRGSEVDTATLGAGFQNAGHEVIIFCRPRSDLYGRLHNDFQCEAVLGGGELDSITIVRCYRSVARVRPDIVVAQKDKDVRPTGLIARLQRIPVLVRHITDRPLKNNLRYRLYFNGRNIHHLANSQATRATVLGSAPWLNGDIAVIPNGIQVDRYVNAEPLDLPLPVGAIAVGFVGQFELRKGIMDFARAWHTVADLMPTAHAITGKRSTRVTLRSRSRQSAACPLARLSI